MAAPGALAYSEWHEMRGPIIMFSLLRLIALYCLCGLALAEVRPLRAVYYHDAPPYSYLQDGKPRGALIEVVQALADAAGVAVTHQCYPWKRAQALVESGEADLMITMPTEQRLSYALASQSPVLLLSKEILVHRQHPALEQLRHARSLPDLRPYRFITYLGDGWAQKNLVEQGYSLQFEASIRDVIRLAAKDARLLIPDLQGTALFRARQMGLAREFEVLPMQFDAQAFHLMLGKRSPHLVRLPDLERAISRLRQNGTLAAILRRASP